MLLSICVLGFAVIVACSSETKPQTPIESAPKPTVAVELHTVARTPVQRVVQATGSLFGEEEASISAKVSGRVLGVFHDVGDVVAPGEELVAIEALDYELAVEERRRAVEQTLARLGLTELPSGDFSVESLPAVDRARLQSENAFARFDRGRILHERTPPAVSDQDFLDLRTAWEVAQADHKVAGLNARSQLAEARTLEAQLATAKQRLADTVHRVPRGVRPSDRANGDAASSNASNAHYAITARRVSVGDFVEVGALLLELIDPDPLEARVRVPEREIARVRVGLTARLRVEAYADEFVGRVARINPAVDVGTRTFEVEVVVANGDGRLRAGSFARVVIESDVDPNALTVPLDSVTTFAGVHKVFVVADGVATERVVQLGDPLTSSVEVREGLKQGEVIVARPPTGLSTGTLVRAADPDTATKVNGGAK